MNDVLFGFLVIVGILVVAGVFWYACYRIQIKLDCYRKYRETKARMKALDESNLARHIVDDYKDDEN